MKYVFKCVVLGCKSDYLWIFVVVFLKMLISIMCEKFWLNMGIFYNFILFDLNWINDEILVIKYSFVII